MISLRLREQFVELAGGRVSFDLSVPFLSISLKEPFAKACELLAGEFFDLCFERFELRHTCTETIVTKTNFRPPNVSPVQLRGQGPRTTGDEHRTRQERGAEAPGDV